MPSSCPMPARAWRLLALTVLAMPSLCLQLDAQSKYTIEPLPLLSNKNVGPGAINDSGHVVGYTYDLGTSASRAFLYRDGVLTELPTLGGDAGSASGINTHGDIVGMSENADGNSRAFLYRNGVMTDLGTLGAGLEASATGINDEGVVVGHSTTVNPLPPGGGTWTAFLWDKGSMVPLGSLLGGTSWAASVNNAGVVAGTTLSVSAQDAKAYRWEGGAMTSLGQIGPDASADSRGGYINAAGAIAGNAEEPGTGDWHPFIHQNGTLTDLGFAGSARGINDSGHVVGDHADGYPFLRTAAGIIDINTLIDPGLGWDLQTASDINNRGQIIGEGAIEGVYRAFILTPPGFNITRPAAGIRWTVGEGDTIRWTGVSETGYGVRFSQDGGYSYELIGGTDKDTKEFVWTPPDSLRSSADCFIKVSEGLDESVADSVGPFLVRGYDLARALPGGTLEFFTPSIHGWSFGNDGETMWPEDWYEQFDYATMDDPFTESPFTERFRRTTRAAASDFPDWQLFVETFGYDKCYGGSPFPHPSESAMEAWKVLNGDWNGACFGFPTSALLAFERAGDFFPANPGVPATPSLFSLFLTNTTRRTVNKYFLYQSDMVQIEHLIQDSMEVTPRDLLEELRAKLPDEGVVHSTLSMFAPGVSRAHTLIPYAVVRDGDGARFRILVYDPNDPGKDDSFILIDSLDNTWQEFLGLGYNVGNVGLLLNLPITHFLPTPVLSLLEFGRDGNARSGAARGPAGPDTPGPAAAATPLWIYAGDTASVVIVSESGDTLGYDHGKLWSGIPGAVPVIPQVAVNRPPMAYYLPPGSYTVSVPSATDSGKSVLFQNEGAIYRYTSQAGAPESPIFQFDSGLSVSNSAGVPQGAFLKTIVPGGGREFVFEMDNVDLAPGAELRIRPLNGGGLILENPGPATSFDLLAAAAGGDAVVEFTAPGVTVQAGASITATVLPGLPESLTLYFDEGMDGSVDDSLTVGGTLVGVEAAYRGALPAGVTLLANYPNPFNPSTTVWYEVPERSHVSVKVFDVLGKEVATLVDRVEEPGPKQIVWEAGDRPAGVYYLRMNAEGFSATEKMLLVR